jgi:TolB-like protein/Tfp pilus assembly protein PilF
MASVKAAQIPVRRAAGHALRVRILGPMTVAVGDTQVSIPSRRARALLGYLALREGTAVARGVLAGLLWGERAEEQARASLRQALSELRAALGQPAQDAIVATKETVTFSAGAAWIDARLVESLAASDDPGDLRSATEHLGGELMEGMAVAEPGFEQWLVTERERFRLLASTIHARLLHDAEQGGRPEEALAHGLKLLGLDPLQESVHRTMMRLYATQGRHDAALAQYERCRRELARNLGVGPEPETEALARTIRAARRARPDTPAAPAVLAAEPAGRPAIAVLPFGNLSDDPEQQYFSDGIAEDIITELSRYHSLRPIARNSCFRFRGDADVAEVREALGVRYVVEGGVRRAGDRIRVTARLIDARDGTQVWAERYDREGRDIFAIQDEIARTVVATLEGRIAASGAEHTRRKPPADWGAYDYLLRGRECNYRYRVAEAVPLFARAAELDPGYAQAHAWLAIMLGVVYVHDERPGTLAAAFASASEALGLDDNDALCHNAMAYVALRRCEFALAGHHHDRAFALNPNDPEVAAQRANWLMHVGRLDEALATLDAALERDPFPPTWVWDTRGYVLYHLGRYDEAILAFRSVRAEHFWIASMLAACYAQAGRSDEARGALARYLALRPGTTRATASDKIVYADETMRLHWLDGLRKAGLPE